MSIQIIDPRGKGHIYGEGPKKRPILRGNAANFCSVVFPTKYSYSFIASLVACMGKHADCSGSIGASKKRQWLWDARRRLTSLQVTYVNRPCRAHACMLFALQSAVSR
jgi:hypothetical protein